MTQAAKPSAAHPPAAPEIVNPRTGQRMIFPEPADASLLRIDSFNPPTKTGEPEHTHPYQESRTSVISGRLNFEVDGKGRVVGPGETIVIPAGVPHRFWNDGPEEAHSTAEFRPALNGRAFFETLFRLEADGKVGKDGMPSLLQTAVLLPAYAAFIRPTRPPWPVLLVAAAVLAPIGRLLGYRAAYP